MTKQLFLPESDTMSALPDFDARGLFPALRVGTG